MFNRLKSALFTGSGEKYRKNYKYYIFQSSLIFGVVSLILLLYEFFGGIFVASLGGSGFSLFIFPHANASRAKCVIGGYMCGAVAGILFNLLYNFIYGFNFAGNEYVLILICAAASAVTAFLMITLDMVHSPAAALALGLAKGPDCVKTAIAAIAGAVILCVFKRILDKYLKNLI